MSCSRSIRSAAEQYLNGKCCKPARKMYNRNGAGDATGQATVAIKHRKLQKHQKLQARYNGTLYIVFIRRKGKGGKMRGGPRTRSVSPATVLPKPKKHIKTQYRRRNARQLHKRLSRVGSRHKCVRLYRAAGAKSIRP